MRVSRALTLATALVLSGCSTPTLMTGTPSPGARSMFTYAAADNEVKTVVVGNPFKGMPQAQFDKVVLSAMQGNNNGPRTHFTTTPGPDAHTNFRVVMAFNAPSNLNSTALCGDTAALKPTHKGSHLTIQTAFCTHNELLSDVSVRMPTPSSVNSPNFRDMIGQSVRALIPLHDHQPSNSCDSLSNC